MPPANNPNRYSDAARRLLEESGVPFVVGLESDRPEFSFLKGEFLGGNLIRLAAAGTGTRSCIQIFNPARSGTLLTVTRIVARQAAVSSLITVRRHDTELTTPLVGMAICRDSRMPTFSGTAQFFTQSPAAQPGLEQAQFSVRHENATFQFSEYLDPLIIDPGCGYLVAAGADNVALDVSWTWREHSLPAPERRNR